MLDRKNCFARLVSLLASVFCLCRPMNQWLPLPFWRIPGTPQNSKFRHPLPGECSLKHARNCRRVGPLIRDPDRRCNSHQTHAMRAAILVSQTFEDPRFLIAVTDIMVFVPPVINGLLPLFCAL